MQQLAAYLKEREGFDSVITDEGFASYRINGDDCYIRDIYIHHDYRKGGAASAIADQIASTARRFGCRYLTGSVDTSKGDPTASTKILLAYGFKVVSAVQGGIWFRKDL
jgi:GNAT superfamily N-acetyltransferase